MLTLGTWKKKLRSTIWEKEEMERTRKRRKRPGLIRKTKIRKRTSCLT